jgi:hypothetical protein
MGSWFKFPQCLKRGRNNFKSCFPHTTYPLHLSQESLCSFFFGQSAQKKAEQSHPLCRPLLIFLLVSKQQNVSFKFNFLPHLEAFTFQYIPEFFRNDFFVLNYPMRICFHTVSFNLPSFVPSYLFLSQSFDGIKL